MTKSELSREANRFRAAIEKTRDAGEFVPSRFKSERMNSFPYDCCDDAADLFTHYLYHEFGIDSIRIHATYYDEKLQRDCYHDWQKVNRWHVDLTGDQFDNDSSLPINAGSVYVGMVDDFHRQFDIIEEKHSCGIECLGDGSWDRMYGLYNAIMKYMR